MKFMNQENQFFIVDSGWESYGGASIEYEMEIVVPYIQNIPECKGALYFYKVLILQQPTQIDYET